MIYDCFLYSGEQAHLKIRVNEMRRLEPLKKFMPVTHIVVESEHTFTGIKRPMSFKYEEWMEDTKILWFPDIDSPDKDPWVNETRLRNLIKSALINSGVKDDDIIIISDCDEIPRAYAIQHYHIGIGLAALQQDIYYYYLNTRSELQTWRLARIMPWSYLKDKTPDEVRRSGFNIAMMNAGWHYTYSGGVANILNKFKSFSHQEKEVQQFADKALLLDKMNRLESLWSKDKLSIVQPHDMPLYVNDHPDEFKDLIYVP